MVKEVSFLITSFYFQYFIIIDMLINELIGNYWAPQGFWGSVEKGYLFSGSWGAELIILGELGSKHILFGI